MTAYYNENDPYKAQWLRNLIDAGHIAPGVVDERDIRDVRPNELTVYRQCHFFAGIGIWSLALRNAGWQDDRPVWTGSCPCGPFSSAGRKEGFADERHLWPHWHYLIAQLNPSEIFGEQVASKDGLAWLDLVQTDLEATEYAVGALDLCAAGFGAPHIRQRIYFVAHAYGMRRAWIGGPWKKRATQHSQASHMANPDANGRRPGGLSVRPRRQNEAEGFQPRNSENNDRGAVNGFWGEADWIACSDDKWRSVEPGTFPLADGVPAGVGRLRAYGDAIVAPQAEEFIRAYMGN